LNLRTDHLKKRRKTPYIDTVPFTSLYVLENEWAAEIANRTMHAIHIGWVPDGAGGYRGQMAILVKPNGLLGGRLSGRDHAMPAADHLPGDTATDRARLSQADP